jgi:hypothetical protein
MQTTDVMEITSLNVGEYRVMGVANDSVYDGTRAMLTIAPTVPQFDVPPEFEVVVPMTIKDAYIKTRIQTGAGADVFLNCVVDENGRRYSLTSSKAQ